MVSTSAPSTSSVEGGSTKSPTILGDGDIKNGAARAGANTNSNLNREDGVKNDTPKDMAPHDHEEYQYLNLVREILEKGEERLDRFVLLFLFPTPPLSHILVGVWYELI